MEKSTYGPGNGHNFLLMMAILCAMTALVALSPYIFGYLLGILMKAYCVITGTSANPLAIGA